MLIVLLIISVVLITINHKSCLQEAGVVLPPRCEVIHLAIICAGNTTTSSSFVATLARSIVFHCASPLHFHLVVDSAAREVLVQFFGKWQTYQGKWQTLPSEVRCLQKTGEENLPKLSFAVS